MPFRTLPLPESGFAFVPRRSVADSRKRGRAAADVDGEHSCVQKKKRRLRLFLITSRLSPQYSHPATNIVDKGSSKIAVWVKQKAAGRNLLRKAAVLNRIRRSAVAARDAVSRRRLLVEQEKEQRQLELARLTFDYGAIDTYTRPVHSPTEPVPPSATIRNASYVVLSGSSPTTSPPSSSPTTSRSPSPTSTGPTLTGASPSHNNPNAAYALSPPRSQPQLRTYEPHLPSPLGLSNYDAFDSEAADAGHGPSIDMYADLDDDAEEDRYSSLWDEDEDEDQHARFDNLSTPSVRTDSFSTATTGVGHALLTPPCHVDAFDDSDRSGLVRRRLDADPTGPVTDVKRTVEGTWGYPFEAGMLPLRYPGAPVSYGEQNHVSEAPAVTPRLVPASMSPNFMAADKGG
ncbi:hypothetical protein G6514_009714 [Epicoccum nigrum]|nr:hypothetical protein G6514_009714 [Epicoccum nigrum]